MKKSLNILAIVTSLMIATSAFGQTSNTSGVQAVDIGLSVLWADRNVGADSPSDYGNYYAWGEIRAKFLCSWDRYKWCNGHEKSLSKYNTSDKYGTVDNRTLLYDEDDVAHVKLGGNWRMPTKDEFDELLATKGNENYKWKWTSIKGHKGWKITFLLNKQSIFLPAAGHLVGISLHGVGSRGYYWSASLATDSPRYAWLLDYSSKEVSTDHYHPRCNGHSVRPVTE